MFVKPSYLFTTLTANMKLVLFASLIAVAVAAPRDGLVMPVAAGPAPAPAPVFDGPIQPLACGPSQMLRKGDISGCSSLVAPQPVIAAPAVPSPSNPSPLVQIVLNINQGAAGAAEVAPEPVQVVETAPIPVDPVHVVETAPEPVQVVETAPEPVQVVEVAPVPVEPVLIGTPVLPAPAINLPEPLN